MSRDSSTRGCRRRMASESASGGAGLTTGYGEGSLGGPAKHCQHGGGSDTEAHAECRWTVISDLGLGDQRCARRDRMGGPSRGEEGSRATMTLRRGRLVEPAVPTHVIYGQARPVSAQSEDWGRVGRVGYGTVASSLPLALLEATSLQALSSSLYCVPLPPCPRPEPSEFRVRRCCPTRSRPSLSQPLIAALACREVHVHSRDLSVSLSLSRSHQSPITYPASLQHSSLCPPCTCTRCPLADLGTSRTVPW